MRPHSYKLQYEKVVSVIGWRSERKIVPLERSITTGLYHQRVVKSIFMV